MKNGKLVFAAMLCAGLGLLTWYLGELRARHDLKMIGHDYLIRGSFPQTTPSYASQGLFVLAGVLMIVAVVRKQERWIRPRTLALLGIGVSLLSVAIVFVHERLVWRGVHAETARWKLEHPGELAWDSQHIWINPGWLPTTLFLLGSLTLVISLVWAIARRIQNQRDRDSDHRLTGSPAQK
jgi:ABC-type Fe3+-siderophore transport system permease subunit